MPLDFHPLSLADRDRVWKYTAESGRRNCDLSFANLYAWWSPYHTEVAEWGGFLLFRFHTDGHLAYLMPVGADGDWCAVLRVLKEDACRRSSPLLVVGVCGCVSWPGRAGHSPAGVECRVVDVRELPEKVLGMSGLYLSLMMN